MTQETAVWPVEIRLNKDKNALTVRFEDGKDFDYTAEFLRVMSPSAEVQGHSPEQRQTVPGKRHVLVRNLEQIGNYAVKIAFDDGHDTGLFSWSYLYELGEAYEARWSDYLSELETKGLGRD
ncbi:MAG: gamma-butyrobetaine hydroxylase-like domain-containing protein [Methyloligellaceae bacterium]